VERQQAKSPSATPGLVRVGGVAAALALFAWSAAAQQFQPPRAGAAGRGTQVGLFGFGVRTGAQFSRSGEFILGAELDVGNLLVSRLRLRPSGEIGFDGERSYLASFEVLYRFADDAASVIPYLGTGAGVGGHDDCGLDPGCPSLWVNLVLGFEVRFRSTFNWLVEYHAVDALRRHRAYVGLTTRRGG
jgi:hypothetical protein